MGGVSSPGMLSIEFTMPLSDPFVQSSNQSFFLDPANSVKIKQLFFLLEQVVVFPDEFTDGIAHAEQLLPLLLIEGYGEAAQAVDRNRALLAHLQEKLTARPLESLVFRTQPLEFRFEVLIFRHSFFIVTPVVTLVIGA